MGHRRHVAAQSGNTRRHRTAGQSLHLCLRDGQSERLRIIGSILETIVAPEDPKRLVERMADPRVLIVTLTVTEKGYLTNLASRSCCANTLISSMISKTRTGHVPSSASSLRPRGAGAKRVLGP